ncbi:hypothetical protein EsVE80_12830 [Enterococcus saigonensis]|uniref:DUF7278 domain-containing protein n=1 Tax=Enterococcus saigonensis TaxID=1805431 RepID=A0A679IBT4_9ENTE|nr:hypothetical protein [Enterococcus saigonensis]BCA85760.1 hypothetical protein EsVE80_12830 [Enterococcus saigonensis]
MNLFEMLRWNNWKNLTDEAKIQAFQQVLMYFVSPLKEITNLELLTYQLDGVKCRTFELEIDGEIFVFVPGQSEAILGWDLGIQGLPTNAWAISDKTALNENDEQIMKEYHLNDLDSWDLYVNLHTSPLRKTDIPPMLVQKHALPVGTRYLGMLDTVTGEFTGDMEKFSLFESEVKEHFMAPKTFAESLSYSLPYHVLSPNSFYLELADGTDSYYVFEHFECTQKSLIHTLQNEGFDLLNEDQWEFMVGAGTRKLFRWGNNADVDESYWGRQVKTLKQGANMFGVVINGGANRYELITNTVLKMDHSQKSAIPLLGLLPEATYYRANRRIKEEEQLMPQDFLYRKAILIELE